MVTTPQANPYTVFVPLTLPGQAEAAAPEEAAPAEEPAVAAVETPEATDVASEPQTQQLLPVATANRAAAAPTYQQPTRTYRFRLFRR